MENGLIPDGRISSDTGGIDHGSEFGRLNDKRGSWCMWLPKGVQAQLYLQIDLRSLHIICAVSTQGGYTQNGASLWVKKYSLQSSIVDNKTWTDYTENGQVKVLYKVI